MTDEVIVDSKNFSTEYIKDISSDKLIEEILYLKNIHKANLDDNSLSPLLLLNNITKLKTRFVSKYMHKNFLDLASNSCLCRKIL